MQRTLNTTLLGCLLALAGLTTNASAQEHQHPPADTTTSMPVDHGDAMDHHGMDHDGMTGHTAMKAMMQMHGRMMADPVIQQQMMADPEMRALMERMHRQMMGGEADMAALHARMATMPAGEREALMERMHEQMMAMPKAEREALMDPMRQMHERMMADPRMHERMMADPEMRRMMEEGMMKDGMNHNEMKGMDHSQMKHMDHDRMPGMKHDQGEHTSMSASELRDAEAASRTADRFRAALVAGDREAVMALLHPDVVILEGGKTETRAEYLGHHFEGDTAFLSAMAREPLVRRTEVAGEAAWVSSTSRLHGTYKDRSLDMDSAELLVLRREPAAPEGWRIAAVHWSSRSRN